MEISDYSRDLASEWDEFVDLSFQGTFLHTRKYLSHQGDLFYDESLVVTLNGRLVGLFPAASSIEAPNVVVSHPGLTYGGILHGKEIRGSAMSALIDKFKKHYSCKGYSALVYKPVPFIYHRHLSQDDVYSLLNSKCTISQCDLSSVIDLRNRGNVSQRRKRSLRKALKNDICIESGFEYLEEFWEILTENLIAKYNRRPVHDIMQIRRIVHLFPDCLSLHVAKNDDRVIAGVLFFLKRNSVHCQYIASNPLGQKLCALDILFEAAIKSATESGCLWFSFGTSTDNAGAILNESLYKFKSEFGSTSIAQMQLSLPLLA